MCQIEYWKKRSDPVKALLWSFKFHSGLHFDDTVLSTKRDQDIG